MKKIEKTVAASKITISQLMMPQMANTHGNVHGGWIMKLVDEAGAIACMRHSQEKVVTVSIDQMSFQHPIRIGDLVILEAEVSFAGNTSMEAEVNVFAENVREGKRWHTNKAYLVYVALDKEGNPVKVPGLIAETDGQRERMRDAVTRQEFRLKMKRKSVTS
jgi:uncharacterized protein (TIGR00369 family)